MTPMSLLVRALAALAAPACAWALLATALLPRAGLAAPPLAPAGPPPASTPDASAVAAASVQQFVHQHLLPELAAARQRHGPAEPRVEVEVGTLPPRLHLAPCQRVEPHLPAGSRLWGSTRVGLRCVEGAVRWNVYVPLVVKVWAPALVAHTTLPAGHAIAATDLSLAVVDLAAESSPALAGMDDALGRVLARPLTPGTTLRANQLRAREHFAAGSSVRLSAVGPGYSVQSQGTALTAGEEGRLARVRMEGGRIVSVRPTGPQQAELVL
jgi:flagellar basal body P-ring formation protein FlgA